MRIKFKKIKKFVSIAVSLFIVISAFACLTAVSAESGRVTSGTVIEFNQKIIAPLDKTITTTVSSKNAVSGTCGDNASWSYNTSTHTLTVSGTGDMDDYDSATYSGASVTTAPWKEYYNDMTSLVIESGITSIGYKAFYNCNSLVSVSIPNTVTDIAWYAFWGCSHITSLNVPGSVESIGLRAFQGCTALVTLTLNSGLVDIGNYAFNGCTALGDFTVPNTVTRIGTWAFANCRNITSVSLPSSVNYIGNYAFYNCSSLLEITIESSSATIGTQAIPQTAKIYCQNNSSAKTYATSNGNSYSYIHEHTYGEWAVSIAATCSDAGLEERECSVCGKVESRTVSALGHTWSADWSYDKQGHFHRCSVCGARSGQANHVYDDAEDSICNVCGCTVRENVAISPSAMQVSTEIKQANASETVSLTVDLKNAPATTSVAVSNITYDTSALTLNSVSWQTTGATISTFDNENGMGVVSYMEETDINGRILVMNFTVSNTVTPGIYAVDLTVTVDESGTKVNAASISGAVEILGRSQCICGGKAVGEANHTCSSLDYSKWTNSTALPTQGNFYLDTDVTVSDVTTVASTLNLDLNGHTITKTAATRVFLVQSGKTLNITDSQTGGAILGDNITTDNAGAMVYVAGTFHIFSGTVSSGKSTSSGGIMFIAATGAASISGNSVLTAGNADRGGIIFNYGGTALIYGSAQLTNGTTTTGTYTYGGILYNTNSGSVTISGTPTLSGGLAARDGGGIYNHATLTITSGTVANNRSNTGKGGNIYTTGTGNTSISGAVITGGYARYGGNVYSNNNQAITDTTISGGTAVYYGGNIFVQDGSSLSLTRTTVSSGTAANAGADIYVGYSFWGTAITGASLTVGSGSVVNSVDIVYPFSSVNISGGTVTTLNRLTLNANKTAIRTVNSTDQAAFNNWYLLNRAQVKIEGGDRSMRFTALIDGNFENYKYVGFAFQLSGEEEHKFHIYNIYSSNYQDGQEVAIGDYSLESDYYFHCDFTFDDSIFTSYESFTITPFIETYDSGYVYGTSQTISMAKLKALFDSMKG